jgi:hypothetical protein
MEVWIAGYVQGVEVVGNVNVECQHATLHHRNVTSPESSRVNPIIHHRVKVLQNFRLRTHALKVENWKPSAIHPVASLQKTGLPTAGTDVMIFKVLSPKHLQYNWRFYTARLCENWIRTLFLRKTPIFRSILAKIDEICDLNIDLRYGWVALIENTFFQT